MRLIAIPTRSLLPKAFPEFAAELSARVNQRSI